MPRGHHGRPRVASSNQGTRAYVPIEMLAAAGGAPVSAVASIQVISSNSSPCLTSTTGEVSCWGSLPHLANWPSPYYPSPYQEGGAFPLILKLCGNTGYGNSGTLGTTFLDTNGIYHEGGMAYVGGQAPTCGP